MASARRAFAFLILASCHVSETPPLRRFSFAEPHMGTTVRVVLYARAETRAVTAARAAFAEFARLDALMSDYRPQSELSRLSRSSGPQPVSPELFDVLKAARHYSEISGGAFDITVGPVVRLWRKARIERKLPDENELRSALGRTGHAKVVLDTVRRTAEVQGPGMQLDLGGIAKGYACDRALEILRDRGVRHAFVDAGGGMALGDPPPGQPGWRIQLADEEDKILLLANCGVATSGDWDQYVEVGGKRYSHIVDPKTGLGLTSRATVTVLARDGMSADALSTTVSVLGPKDGLDLAEDLPGVEAWIKWAEDGKTRTAETSGFSTYLRK